MSGINQEYVLSRWRADEAKDDPPFYAVQQRHGRLFVWMNIGGNVGWYAPEMNGAGKMVGIRGEAWPLPSAHEDEETRKTLNWQFKLISPKQERKIETLMATR